MACAPPKPSTYEKNEMDYISTISNEKIAVTYFVHLQGEICKTNNVDIAALSNSKITVIFSHGNADDLGTASAYCAWAAKSFGVNVVSYDYPGYGHSDTSNFSENLLHICIYSVYLHTMQNFIDHKLWILGKSLGSVPSIWLASQKFRNICGVILISPLASGVRTICNISSFSKTPKHLLDSIFADCIEMCSCINVPVLLFHGKNDEIVPVHNAYEIFSKLQSIKLGVLFDAKHNDIEVNYPNQIQEIVCGFITNQKPTQTLRSSTTQSDFHEIVEV